MAPALCHSCGGGPKYPWLSQVALPRGGSCVRAAQESPFSSLSPRGAGRQLGEGASVSHCPSQQEREAAGTAGMQVCHAHHWGLCLVCAKLKRLKMSKPASLEPTPLPGQDPSALGLKCPYPASLQSPQCQGMCWAGMGAGAHRDLLPGYCTHPTSTAASPLQLWGPRIAGTQSGTLHMSGQ